MSGIPDEVDLARAALGGVVIAANDDFFAPKEALIEDAAPVFKPGVYTDRGKWMDGWETRRRREPGFDWCIVRLGARGVVHGVTIDTAFFTGNYPEACSIDACDAPPDTDVATLSGSQAWRVLVPRTSLEGDSQTHVEVTDPSPVTHVRLNIFPDGGVARLRVWGEARPDWRAVLMPGEPVDLAAAVLGSRIVGSSDMHFGSGANLLMPGSPRGMADGWETKRRRGPGHDWIVVRLARPGRLQSVEVDTRFFKGNAPGRCSLDVSTSPVEGLQGSDALAIRGLTPWLPCLPETTLSADTLHRFDLVDAPDRATFARLNIFPDGGVARLRLFGVPSMDAAESRALALARLNALGPDEAATELRACCGSSRWVQAMASARPFASESQMFARAEEAWWALGEPDWLEAFAHHPRLGGRAPVAATADAGRARAWSSSEQSGVSRAEAEVRAALAEANADYERRFGFIFIACASGKSGDQLLDLLRQRLSNRRDDEVRVAAAEQAAITRLRLEKFLA